MYVDNAEVSFHVVQSIFAQLRQISLIQSYRQATEIAQAFVIFYDIKE